MSAERWIVEGEWSGYTSSQRHVVHRAVISKRTALAIRMKLGWITYPDGTTLNLSVRPCQPREKVVQIHGYDSLISDCLALGVSSVAAIGPAREAARNERLTQEART